MAFSTSGLTPQVDLTTCDREPIHILGAIQSFGFLLAVSADWMVCRASVNVDKFMPWDFESALGKPLDALFSAPALHDIRNRTAILRGKDAVERMLSVPLLGDGRHFDVALHYSGSTLVIECEPSLRETDDATSQLRAMLARLDQTETLASFLNDAARQIRAVTGFDRVMVYRYDAEGNGEVVAEARERSVDSFLGLHYPASDIPAQARALYVRNSFRVIADVGSEPVLIAPQFDPTGAPLDLSMSVQRSVSPIHIEYLKNMGVAASLSISIIVEGRLWGLFACHHYKPRLPSFADRTLAELFGSMFSLKLANRERIAAAEYDMRAREISDRLMASAAYDPSRLSDAQWMGSIVSEAIACDGVGVISNGEITLSGLTPNEAEFRGVVSMLNRTAASTLFITENLTSILPEAAAYANRAAGLLAIPISRTPRDYVVLFRAEQLRSVRWAGEPDKMVEVGPLGDRLTPRRSFAEWSETVRNKSVPFAAPERRIAEALRVTLLEVVLKLTDQAGEERRRSEERQALLIAELNHRVRNILGLVRGLISQSKSSHADPIDALNSLDSRVQALARAHNQVTAEQWGPGDLDELIRTEASAFLGEAWSRVHASGPPVGLEPEAFTVVALVMHELVTNAAKYGALSDSGTVDVTWRLSKGEGLIIEWREQNGPAVRAPTRRGFGTTIIERSIPHELKGRAEVRYKLRGLEADFCIPETFTTPLNRASAPAPQPVEANRSEARAELLRGRNVLLVEDSLTIAMHAEDILRELGAADVVTVSSITAALGQIAQEPLDLAILDVNLGRETSIAIAEELLKRSIPFVFATGYGAKEALPPTLEHTPVVTKPYDLLGLASALEKVVHG